MITQLLTQLEAAEKIGIAVAKAAEAAYSAAVKSRAPVEQTAALDPGRHQLTLGAIRTAIAHLETIIGDAEDRQEQAAGGTPSGAAGTGGTINEPPALRAAAVPSGPPPIPNS
jgi:hypothetical protein